MKKLLDTSPIKHGNIRDLSTKLLRVINILYSLNIDVYISQEYEEFQILNQKHADNDWYLIPKNFLWNKRSFVLYFKFNNEIVGSACYNPLDTPSWMSLSDIYMQYYSEYFNIQTPFINHPSATNYIYGNLASINGLWLHVDLRTYIKNNFPRQMLSGYKIDLVQLLAQIILILAIGKEDSNYLTFLVKDEIINKGILKRYHIDYYQKGPLMEYNNQILHFNTAWIDKATIAHRVELYDYELIQLKKYLDEYLIKKDA